MTTAIPTPFRSSAMSVKPEWIDYNGHMNMAYYNVLFDLCADEAYALLGLGPNYAENRGMTTYTGEFKITYKRELHLGDEVNVTLQLIDHDEKRFHTYQEIWHVDGWLAATAEALALHIDRSGPRVAPFPPDIAAKFAQMQEAHNALPRPTSIGKGIGIQRKPS